jgi:hypothetical protein
VVTLNPSDKSSLITLSGGDLIALRATGSTSWAGVRATAARSSGKHYFEMKNNANGATNGSMIIGLATISAPLTYPGAISGNYGFQTNDLSTHNVGKYTGGSYASSSYTNGTASDTSCIAVDLDAGKIWFRIAGRGTWMTGDPATGTTPTFTFTPGTTMYPMAGLFSNPMQITANFGGTAFADTPPSGFGAW